MEYQLEETGKITTKNNEINSLLSSSEIDNCFDIEFYLRNINSIYERFGV